MSDEDDFFSVMYNNEEPSTVKSPAVVSNGRTKRIRVGAITTEVPSVEYVAELELLVKNQAKQIETLMQNMRKMQSMFSNSDRNIRKQASEIDGLWRNLDKKIEKRF